MADLITLAQAQTQLQAAPVSNGGLIQQCLSAASNVIETYCNRRFTYGQYDELHTVVGPTGSIWVNNPPVGDVTAVRNCELPALYVQYNDPLNQTQRASVDITSTAVVLTLIYNGVTTVNTFTYAAYPTFTTLAAGVNALGGGWAATLPQQFALWQTGDLTTNYTGRSARNVSLPLTVFWYQLWGYRVNKDLGEVILPLPARGTQNYRITYTGGFQFPPVEIEQACCELTQLTYLTILANPLMGAETIDRYSYTRAAATGFGQLSATSKAALNQFRVHRFTRNGVPAQQ